ncbi:uncharacterized protein J8A68_005107 [[Candida] subhashii]|uniref:Cytochrome b5 heme-binding domain-containing protein n=1 Tax=[Candida] subhashii TaxID=561895 RepID=A0A8J5UIV5_9ASCO|nr:uncharacterized protein J8A68_005107 [[Candida] subhashii]KAG7661412.1 hypothetical protein J8A68_005107 [[Candida] subhashii]
MTRQARNRFNLIDILQILSGLLLLNAFLSWWFTSTPTWGYEGKWINPSYLKHRFISPTLLNLSISELALYNGTDSSLPIYVAVNHRVYDVTAGTRMYGPGGPYNKLSGKDASRVYVTGCFMNPGELTYDLRGLDEKEIKEALDGWVWFFENNERYWYVGEVT